MTLFDASTWTGKWPFAFCDSHTARGLAVHLRRHGIAQALVSPLDAVFAPEPGPANRALLRDTRGVRALVPVPVINPALGNGRELLAEMATDRRVRAVRVLPAYHNFSLRGRAMAELVAELPRHGLRLVVQMRLIDERHEYHAMNLTGLPAKDLGDLLRRNPALPVLASGLLRPDLLALVPKHPQLLADLAYAEWHDTLEYLAARVPAGQLALASHTPFLVTAAARAKVDSSTLTGKVKAAIAGGNLRRFLG